MSENGKTASCDGFERKSFPFDVRPLDPSIEEQLLNDFRGEKKGFVQIGPKNYILPASFRQHADKLYNFHARPDDTWIVTFPRSGTTMTQELIWLIANDFDFDCAQREDLMERFPFFEYCLISSDNSTRTTEAPVYEILANVKSPRFIKTHLPLSLMPPSVMTSKAKVIYVARDPKDAAVSWYHLSCTFKSYGFVNDFAQFWDYFETGLTFWSPYWEHIEEGWEHRTNPNVLFLFYEDLVKDLPTSISKIAKFLNKDVNDENRQRLAEHLKIENFRNNPSVNLKSATDSGLMAIASNDSSFIRVGKVSGREWQKEYTPELIARAEKWIAMHLEDTTLRFPQY